jgi:hypothetical protein
MCGGQDRLRAIACCCCAIAKLRQGGDQPVLVGHLSSPHAPIQKQRPLHDSGFSFENSISSRPWISLAANVCRCCVACRHPLAVSHPTPHPGNRVLSPHNSQRARVSPHLGNDSVARICIFIGIAPARRSGHADRRTISTLRPAWLRIPRTPSMSQPSTTSPRLPPIRRGGDVSPGALSLCRLRSRATSRLLVSTLTPP